MKLTEYQTRQFQITSEVLDWLRSQANESGLLSVVTPGLYNLVDQQWDGGSTALRRLTAHGWLRHESGGGRSSVQEYRVNMAATFTALQFIRACEANSGKRNPSRVAKTKVRNGDGRYAGLLEIITEQKDRINELEKENRELKEMTNDPTVAAADEVLREHGKEVG